jgi:hypothetical protein
MFTGYQNQAALFNRLKNEMIGLYAKVNFKSIAFYSLKISLKINAQEQTIIILNRERFLLAKENASLSKFYIEKK